MSDNKAGTKGNSGKEVCRAFRNTGKCRFDKECKYEHSAGPAIEAPPRDFTPKGDCHNWTESKECRFGERCRFLHGAEDKRTTYRVARTENTSGEQEICRNFQNRGKCRFGDSCKHKHVAGDKKPAAEKKSSGGAGVGAGAGADGAGRRRRRGPRAAGDRKETKQDVTQYDKDGVEICRNQLKGRCKYGSECQYSHGSPATSVPAAGGGGAGRNTDRNKREPKDCKQFAEGNCDYGSECRFKHGANDTRDLTGGARKKREPGPCYNFQEKGECEYGAECRFKH